jgi:hypothetical protein
MFIRGGEMCQKWVVYARKQPFFYRKSLTEKKSLKGQTPGGFLEKKRLAGEERSSEPLFLIFFCGSISAQVRF